MKKQTLFLTMLSLLFANNSFANTQDFFKNLKDNGDLQIGIGANYYQAEEKHGEDKKKFAPIASFGYKYNFTNNVFINANINYDVVKLASKSLFSETEYCDAEDIAEGECGAIGSYKAKAEGQDIESNRLADINIGYNFNNGLSLFAGIGYYQIDYKYKNTSFEALDAASLSDFYELDGVDDGDDSAIGYGLGLSYNIKDTDFSTKLMYNTVSFDGGSLDNGGKQKITEHQISFSIIYSFL